MSYSPEAAFVEWLEARGYDAAQYMRDDAAGVFVTVERTGGGVYDYVDRPEFALQVWAPTSAQALQAATDLRTALLITAPPHGFSALEIDSGPYPFPDPDSRRARYQIAITAACILTE